MMALFRELFETPSYKTVKDLATEVSAMKKLLEQSSQIGKDDQAQDQNKRSDDAKDNKPAVPKQLRAEEKKRLPNK